MRYTTLRVTEAGVVLRDGHVRRLAPSGGAAGERFEAFALSAEPGVYALLDDGARLAVERRAGSALLDGMPSRLAPSPVAGAAGPFPKPAPPGPYGAVRRPGVATLLTSPGGEELWEACVAAVVGWDGAALVLVPRDRPRVASLAEAAIRAAVPHVERPLAARGATPLLLVNAVGTCRPAVDGRAPFPPEVAARVAALLAASARRGRGGAGP